jgi:hypothetical protein
VGGLVWRAGCKLPAEGCTADPAVLTTSLDKLPGGEANASESMNSHEI